MTQPDSDEAIYDAERINKHRSRLGDVYGYDPHFAVNYDGFTDNAFIYHVPSKTPLGIKGFEDIDQFKGDELAALFLQWIAGRIPHLSDEELAEKRRLFLSKIHDDDGNITDEFSEAYQKAEAGVLFDDVAPYA